MKPPLKTHYELVAGARIVLVIETTAEPVPAEERPSSTRLKRAEPVATEFDDLRRWRESAVRARRTA